MKFLTTETGRRLAYVQTSGAGPGLVFLGGFMSDMSGTKALHLESWCQAQGRAFQPLRSTPLKTNFKRTN